MESRGSQEAINGQLPYNLWTSSRAFIVPSLCVSHHHQRCSVVIPTPFACLSFCHILATTTWCRCCRMTQQCHHHRAVCPSIDLIMLIRPGDRLGQQLTSFKEMMLMTRTSPGASAAALLLGNDCSAMNTELISCCKTFIHANFFQWINPSIKPPSAASPLSSAASCPPHPLTIDEISISY